MQPCRLCPQQVPHINDLTNLDITTKVFSREHFVGRLVGRSRHGLVQRHSDWRESKAGEGRERDRLRDKRLCKIKGERTTWLAKEDRHCLVK